MQKMFAAQDASVPADFLRTDAQTQKERNDDAHEKEDMQIVVFVERIRASECAPRNDAEQQAKQWRFQQRNGQVRAVGQARPEVAHEENAPLPEKSGAVKTFFGFGEGRRRGCGGRFFGLIFFEAAMP